MNMNLWHTICIFLGQFLILEDEVQYWTYLLIFVFNNIYIAKRSVTSKFAIADFFYYTTFNIITDLQNEIAGKKYGYIPSLQVRTV